MRLKYSTSIVLEQQENDSRQRRIVAVVTDKRVCRSVSPTSSLTFSTGIISSLTFARSRPGLFAAGSFDGSIGFYDASAGENTLLSLLVSEDFGGITQVRLPFPLAVP